MISLPLKLLPQCLHLSNPITWTKRPLPHYHISFWRLKSGVEIWLNGSAESPLLYDRTWGGIVMCGCDFDDKLDKCRNKYPDCPALTGTYLQQSVIFIKRGYDWKEMMELIVVNNRTQTRRELTFTIPYPSETKDLNIHQSTTSNHSL